MTLCEKTEPPVVVLDAVPTDESDETDNSTVVDTRTRGLLQATQTQWTEDDGRITVASSRAHDWLWLPPTSNVMPLPRRLPVTFIPTLRQPLTVLVTGRAKMSRMTSARSAPPLTLNGKWPSKRLTSSISTLTIALSTRRCTSTSSTPTYIRTSTPTYTRTSTPTPTRTPSIDADASFTPIDEALSVSLPRHAFSWRTTTVVKGRQHCDR